MSWSESDDVEIDETLDSLAVQEAELKSKLEKIQTYRYKLLELRSAKVIDFDGATLSDDRRLEFKAKLLSNVDKISE